MKPIRPATLHQKIASALGAVLICGLSNAEDIVRLTAKEPRLAADRQVQYTGTCGTASYIFQVSHERQKIDLVLNAEKRIPLSETRLGHGLFNRPIVGNFAFHCLDETLEIRFFGYQLDPKLPPKPVSYYMGIDFSGQFRNDEGWQNESEKVVVNYFSYPWKR
jgi:hypothetical protein